MIVLYKIDTDIVFYKMSLDFSNEIIELNKGSKIGYDLYGNAMSSYDAVSALYIMSDHKIGKTVAESIQANINLAPILISIVRNDMISVTLTDLGLTATGMLIKLAGIVGAIQVGMFVEAAQMLLATTPDGFLTNTRLSLYASILASADALAQNGYN